MKKSKNKRKNKHKVRDINIIMHNRGEINLGTKTIENKKRKSILKPKHKPIY